MNRIFEGLGRFVVRFRWVVVVLWILVAIVSAQALPSLGSEVNNNNTTFLPASAPSQQAAQLLIPVEGNTSTDSQIIIAASSHHALTATDEASIEREIRAADAVNKVVGAKQVGTSADGNVTEILVEANVSFNDQSGTKTVVDDLAATFAQARAPAGLEYHLAGAVASEVANSAQSNKTGNTVQLLSIVFILLLLLLIFRSVLAPIITLLPAVFALVISMRFIGGLGAHGLKISEITSLLLIILLLGAGTDYGLFLIFRVREEIRGGLSPHDAVEHSLVRVGESITASAGTVIIALLTLLFATFGVYNSLGVPLAVGVGVILIAGLTLLPALLAIFGRAAFWPSKVVASTPKTGWWGKIAVRLVRRPVVTLAIGLVVFAGLATFALGYHSGGFGGSTNAPSGSNAAEGNAIIAAHFPHSTSNPADLGFRFTTPIWSDPSEVALAQASLESSGQFTHLTGPLNANGSTLTPSAYVALYKELGNPSRLPVIESPSSTVPVAQYQAYRSSGQFVAANGLTIAFQTSFRAGNQQSTAALQAVPNVRAAITTAATRSHAVASGVDGEAAGLYDVSGASSHDLLHVFPIAILAIGLLLALVLRSLIAPLYLIVSVALSYVSALGVSTLIFIDIGGQGGLTFILPFLMFIFLLALGEDYNILVMTRIREETQRLPLREAVARAVGVTGPTVTSAGLVLAGTFGVLAVAGGGGQITDIGAGLAIGILMDTFLVRTLLVPATVVILGRWNWWPSRMSRSSQTPAGGHRIDSDSPTSTR
jgi:RND superfamily putative drug exporter